MIRSAFFQPPTIRGALLDAEQEWDRFVRYQKEANGHDYGLPSIDYIFKEGEEPDNHGAGWELSFFIIDEKGAPVVFDHSRMIPGSWAAKEKGVGVSEVALAIRKTLAEAEKDFMDDNASGWVSDINRMRRE
jgi:hypothetical protein